MPRNPNPWCEHCADMHDGFYGSYADPCPFHAEDGSGLSAKKEKTPALPPQKERLLSNLISALESTDSETCLSAEEARHLGRRMRELDAANKEWHDKALKPSQVDADYWIVWNADKTEGFVSADKGVAYEVRKASDTNCFYATGQRSDVGVAFCEAWGDGDCAMERLEVRAGRLCPTCDGGGVTHSDAALAEWHDKTEWLRKDLQPHELGKHLADVLRGRCDAN